MSRARFALGRLMQTPGVQDAVNPVHVLACVRLHMAGDWGVIDKGDVAVNEAAVRDGDRILSAYYIDPEKPDRGKFWVITEADRASTTVLLPDEY